MRRLGEHAVVIGGSVAGLLAARVLADAFGTVTVLDRDVLDGNGPRRGVPQARHLHSLLPAGHAVLEELFPGLVRELADGGAPVGEVADVRLYFNGYALQVPRAGLPVVEASRAYLERTLRRRVAAIPAVRIRERATAAGLVIDDDRVRGVQVFRPDSAEETLAADLVVDASGRGSRMASWLAAYGYPAPAEERVRVDVTYVSRRYRLPAGSFGGAMDLVLSCSPGFPRGAALQRQEDGNWLVTLSGYVGEAAPVDSVGWLDYARSLPLPEVAATLDAGEPLTDPVRHRFPESLRRRYERLDRLPARLVVTGDALCSFNPVYGQGMSMAALEAVALRGCLAAGALDGVGRRFLRAAVPYVNVAWDISVGGDLRFGQVPGRRTAKVRLTNAYVRRMHAAGSVDPAVALRFMRVAALLDPPTRLLRPGTVVRVLRAARRAVPAWPPVATVAGTPSLVRQE